MADCKRTTYYLAKTIAIPMVLISAWGCGQKGPLFIPQDPAAAQRATLPESVLMRTKNDKPLSSENTIDKQPSPTNEESLPR